MIDIRKGDIFVQDGLELPVVDVAFWRTDGFASVRFFSNTAQVKRTSTDSGDPLKRGEAELLPTVYETSDLFPSTDANNREMVSELGASGRIYEVYALADDGFALIYLFKAS